MKTLQSTHAVQFDIICHELLQRYAIAGLAIAMIENHQLAWIRCFGVQDATTQAPINKDTVFEAASLSKPVVAYAALQLCESKKLGLQDSLSSYLDYQFDSRVTVYHLLSHTSGLPNWLNDDELPITHFTPGSRFSYSGVGYRVLQQAIEKITGQSLATYLEQSVFKSFGMPNSSFVWQPRFTENSTVGHDKNGVPVDKFKPQKAYAAFSLHSSITDYAAFITSSLNTPIIEKMLEPQMAVNDTTPWKENWFRADITEFPKVHWGLGWGLEETSQGDFFWQWGDNGSFKAFVMVSRDNGQGFIAMTNSANGDLLWQDLTSTLLGGTHPALHWLKLIQVE